MYKKTLLSSIDTLNQLIIQYYSNIFEYGKFYSIIIKNTNIVDTSNVDVSYSYYDKNDTFKIIIGYDRRRFTYTNNNNVITITGIGDLSSGLSIKTPSSETILNSDGTINKCNNKWYLFSNKLDCYKCNNIDYNTILTIK